MIKLICENPVCNAEIKGTGREILEDALNAVHCLYQSLYKNDKRLATVFKVMVRAMEDIFSTNEEEVIRFVDRTKTVPEEYEEAARMVDEALKDFREE